MATTIRAIDQAERAIRVKAQVMSGCAITAHIEAERARLVGDISAHDYHDERARIFESYIPNFLKAEYSYYLYRGLKQAGLMSAALKVG